VSERDATLGSAGTFGLGTLAEIEHSTYVVKLRVVVSVQGMIVSAFLGLVLRGRGRGRL